MTVGWGRTTKIFPIAEWILYWPCQELEHEMEYRCSRNNCNSRLQKNFRSINSILFDTLIYQTLIVWLTINI